MRVEEYYSLEINQTVVEALDGFEVQMAGRLIKDEAVCAFKHELGKHAAHLFSSGEDLAALESFITREEHSSEEGSEIGLIGILYELTEPIGDAHIFGKECIVVLGEVALAGCDTPEILACIRLHIACHNLEKDRLGKVVGTYECNLISIVHKEIQVIENLLAVDDLGQALDFEDVLSALAVRLECNIRDDETIQTADEKNNIDFELTLDNDLEYEKQFTFDLNANDETVVYLRVSPELIDYKSAGSRLWKESVHHDDYYGVDNQNGNNLSVSGSSWQRAYTNSTLNTGVTDGHYYNADDEDLEAQYVSDAKWIEMLLQAYKEGTHHGDYFILKNDIEINTDAYTFPTNFIFTGHLDALDHTITITGTRGYLFDGLDGTYTTAQEEGSTENWEANVHLEGEIWVPTTGWRAETVNVRTANGLLFKDNASINGHVSNCWNATTRINDVTPAIPAYK